MSWKTMSCLEKVVMRNNIMVRLLWTIIWLDLISDSWKCCSVQVLMKMCQNLLLKNRCVYDYHLFVSSNQMLPCPPSIAFNVFFFACTGVEMAPPCDCYQSKHFHTNCNVFIRNNIAITSILPNSFTFSRCREIVQQKSQTNMT